MKLHLGLRTLKTAVCVIIALALADAFGASSGRQIFAVLGVMAAVQPTFQESRKACLTQIVGVILGAAAGLLLRQLPASPALRSGIGILLVIVGYNSLGIRFDPSLACIIVVTVCTTADLRPMDYAFDRIWDTAIGLAVGMLINTLVFPYDNSRRIRSAVHSLDSEVMKFLADMFDGDDHLPDDSKTAQQLQRIARELEIFAAQRLPFRQRRHAQQLAAFLECQKNARLLLSHLTVLSNREAPGWLNRENYLALQDRGAVCPPEGEPGDPVTNYHVAAILRLRQDLLSALARQHKTPTE